MVTQKFMENVESLPFFMLGNTVLRGLEFTRR